MDQRLAGPPPLVCLSPWAAGIHSPAGSAECVSAHLVLQLGGHCWLEVKSAVPLSPIDKQHQRRTSIINGGVRRVNINLSSTRNTKLYVSSNRFRYHLIYIGDKIIKLMNLLFLSVHQGQHPAKGPIRAHWYPEESAARFSARPSAFSTAHKRPTGLVTRCLLHSNVHRWQFSH